MRPGARWGLFGVLAAAACGGDPAAVPATPGDMSPIDPLIGAFVAERGLDGAGFVMVDRDDGIVYEGYWGEFDADRVSFVASSSKMVSAGVLMRLDDDGLLDVDAPVADAVEWGSGNPDVTVAHLLSNSSGLVGLLDDADYGPYGCQFDPARELEECAAEAFTTDADDGDVVPPDSRLRYGGVQWQVAGAVAEAVSGTSWSQLIDETYVEPCGVDSLGYGNHVRAAGGFGRYPDDLRPDDHAATENPNIEGGAFVDAPDYAELLLMHLRGGECPNGRVLSSAAIDRMHTDRVGDAYGGDGADGRGYGFGWWVDLDTGQISDPGAYGSIAWLDLDDGYGAYLVVEADHATGSALAAQLQPLVDTIMSG